MIENTADRDPLIHLAGMWGSPRSRYIEEMERAGQDQLVHSDRMPTDAPTAELEALGFTFGDPDPNDPMFRPATLPAGWSRQGSDHDMWSYIVDDKGRKRVSVFYKAAFYDRSAHASIVAPTARLSDLIYADDDPTSVTLDDLLTADVARRALRNRRDEEEKYVAMLGERGGDTSPYDEQIRRIDVLLRLVDEAAG